MKKYIQFLLTAVTLCTFCVTNCWAQSFPDPFLSDEERPNGLNWLPEPPELTSPMFTYDFFYYQ